VVNSNSLRIRMNILFLKTQIVLLKFKKRRAILPVLVIPALLVGLKALDIFLERKKKK